MKIRIVSINNLVFDLKVDEDDFDGVVRRIYDKKFLKLNSVTYLSTSAIASIQKIN